MTTLLAIEKLKVSFGMHPVLDDLQVEAAAGVLGVCGPNGTGKSTLLRTVAGILRPMRGRIQIAGRDLKAEPVEARKQVGYLPEHADLYPYMSCQEICETVSALRGAPLDGWREHLEALGLQGLEDVRLGTLSAGQQRKVTLLAALCGEPPVLLLDEPTKALDHHSRHFLDQMIDTWKRAGRLILITSHLLSYLQQQCTQFLFLEAGKGQLLPSFDDLEQRWTSRP